MGLPSAVKKQQEDTARLLEVSKKKDENSPQTKGELQEVVEVIAEPGVSALEVTAPEIPSPDNTAGDQKYKVLQGKYHKEVVEVGQRNKQLEDMIGKLTAQVAELETASHSRKATELPDNASDALRKVREEYGDDFVNLIADAARDAAKKEVDGVKGQLNSVVENQTLSKTEKFGEALNKAVPDWVKINKMPEFATWLENYDDLVGVTFRTIALDANSKLDAPRLAAIFKKFIAENPQLFKKTPVKDPLEALVSPDGQSGRGVNDSVVDAEVPSVTREFMRNFAKDLSLGKYKGREEEAAKIQSKINAAIQSKRIVG